MTGLDGKSRQKRNLRNLSVMKLNIRWASQKQGEEVDWIQLSLDSIEWPVLINMIMKSSGFHERG
jgi:hypothetical protein